ncbi:hypothetical protein NESM_000050800 [Novymonas esmeraldas]|uniref:Uncharacterized protein n=1 Tax=Novymonas esmeraldas TaxID=1808958 RepID=A0AAW0F452_9TRYP
MAERKRFAAHLGGGDSEPFVVEHGGSTCTSVRVWATPSAQEGVADLRAASRPPLGCLWLFRLGRVCPQTSGWGGVEVGSSEAERELVRLWDHVRVRRGYAQVAAEMLSRSDSRRTVLPRVA